MPTCAQVVAALVAVPVLCALLALPAAFAVKGQTPSAVGNNTDAAVAGDTHTWLVTTAVAWFTRCQQPVTPQCECPRHHTPCNSVANEVVVKLEGKFQELFNACVNGNQELKTAVENMNATAAESNRKHGEATAEAQKAEAKSLAAAWKYALAMPAVCVVVASYVQIRSQSMRETIFVLTIMAVANLVTLFPQWYAQIGFAVMMVMIAAADMAWREFAKPTIEEQIEAHNKAQLGAMKAWFLGSVKPLFANPAKSGRGQLVQRPAVIIGGHRLASQPAAVEGEPMNTTVTETAEAETDIGAHHIEGSSAVTRLWRDAPGGPASEIAHQASLG